MKFDIIAIVVAVIGVAASTVPGFDGLINADGNAISMFICSNAIPMTLAALVALAFSLLFKVIDLFAHPVEADEIFSNGLNVPLLIKIFGGGASYASLCKYMSETCRKRFLVSWKHYLFFGYDHWVCGHPAIVKQVFSPANMKNWVRADYNGTQSFMYSKPAKPEKLAMLYTGTDDGWRKARHVLTPFFYNTNFTEFDDVMDKVCKKHLHAACENSSGNIELLNLTFRTTLDLVVRVLYGVELDQTQFDCLFLCLSKFIVPESSGLFEFDGKKFDTFEYHMKVGKDLGAQAPDGTLGQIIRDSDLPAELKDANLGFFLEALTPAFASFWAIAHVLTDKTGEQKAKCKEDPVFRQQCIKEALRMYPPVPVLWPRIAQKDMVMANPIYDDHSLPVLQSWLSKLIFGENIENQPKIHIKKGTSVLIIPALMHYDSRFWFQPKDFLPERWENDPFVLEYKGDGGGTDRNEKKGTKHTAAKIRMRNTMTYGAMTEDATVLLDREGRKGAIEICETFLNTQTDQDKNVRCHMFGSKSEERHVQSSLDSFVESTDDTFFDLQKYSFLPFAQGPHACMGRRLALHMVDSILWNFLEYNGGFYSGIVPSLVSSKDWHSRTNATAVVYNAPADPVFVSVKHPAGAHSIRKSIIDGGNSGAMTKDGTTLPATTRSPKKKRSPAGEEKKVHFDSDAIYQTEKENILRDTFSSQFSESFLPAP